MINQIQIQNFQSHKDSTLKLSPGVNVIVGSSDSGKTAILRALRWLIWNRPTGDEFRSDWGGDTRVEIQTKENIIARFKSKDIPNGYSLDTKVLEAIKTDVPEEIQKTLNIDEINLQRQFDSPFLLNDSPGAVATHFNRIARLDQIDKGLKNVNSLLREETQQQKADEQRVKELQDELPQYDYIERFEIELEVLEGMDEGRLRLVANKKELLATIQALETVEEKITKEQSLIQLEKEVTNIINLHSTVSSKEDERERLIELVTDLGEIKELIEEGNRLIALESHVSTLQQMNQQLQEIMLKSDDLNECIIRLKSIDKEQAEMKRKVKTLEETFHREMPDVCPLCGKKQ